MDLAGMAGSGSTIQLGNRTLIIRPLSMGDYGLIRNWLKERLPRPYQVLAQAILDLQKIREAQPEVYQKLETDLMLAAHEDAKGDVITANEKAVEQAMGSADGIALMIWLSVRKDQPDATLEWVTACIGSMSLVDLKRKLDTINVDWMQEMDGATDPTKPVNLQKATT